MWREIVEQGRQNRTRLGLIDKKYIRKLGW